MMSLSVTGMTCGHCVAAVDRAVRGVAGATDVAVDLASGVVRVGGTPDPDAIRAAIAEEGYEARPLQA